ncbi:MAG TPA: tetratricopeptide repeat protein [Bacteroidia bacterium]|jgi:outer membrane protein assembly factor BamD (BamD/ComL family)|nr:tetratricopeptide repeat protein [Bacteroidia bacterium]
MKKIIQNILILILAAFVVFLMFYNCTGTKTEEQPKAEAKDSTSKINSVYANDCRALYLDACKNDSIILAANEIDKKVANKAIKAFADFSFYCPTDTLAPIFLLKAGQIAQSINNLPQAQLSFERVINDFPNFKNRGAAMFLLAQLYDEPSMLNDEEKARELYGQIINTFPGTDWAKNADDARSLLGKTDEQIIKEFEKKNKKK